MKPIQYEFLSNKKYIIHNVLCISDQTQVYHSYVVNVFYAPLNWGHIQPLTARDYNNEDILIYTPKCHIL